jgi:hypothetical protein
MSLCPYCGEKAGWLQSSHPACVAKANSTADTLKELVSKGILAGKRYADLATEVQQVLTANKVQSQYVQETLLQGVNDAISQIALQSPASDAELNRLVAVLQGFDITAYHAEYATRRWFSFAQLGMSNILWHVLHNSTPNFDDTPMFNLRPGETPIFQTGNTNVMYAEERTISSHNRSFGGLSLPVGGGVYYHIGGSQGHQERTSGLQQLDAGGILITSHALYFGGQKTTFRIPLDQVLRYQSYVDGVGVCESHGAPKVFVFDYRGMEVGWFFYNLLSALTNKSGSNDEAAGGEQNTVQKAKHAVANLQNAFDTWLAANDRFTDLFHTDVDVKQVTISMEDLTAYKNAVAGLFAAAHKLEENSQFVSTSARETYSQALRSVERSWATVASLDDGHMNGDAFIPFLNELTAFMKARNAYCESDKRLSN